jgi:hypothetical protein
MFSEFVSEFWCLRLAGHDLSIGDVTPREGHMFRLLSAIAKGLKAGVSFIWNGFLTAADYVWETAKYLVPGHAAAVEAEAAAQAQLAAAHDAEAQRLEAADRNASGACAKQAASYALAGRELTEGARISERVAGWLRTLRRDEIAVIATASGERIGEHLSGRKPIAGLPPVGDVEAVERWRRTPDAMRRPSKGSEDEATLEAAARYLERVDAALGRERGEPAPHRLRTAGIRF